MILILGAPSEDEGRSRSSMASKDGTPSPTMGVATAAASGSGSRPNPKKRAVPEGAAAGPDADINDLRDRNRVAAAKYVTALCFFDYSQGPFQSLIRHAGQPSILIIYTNVCAITGTANVASKRLSRLRTQLKGCKSPSPRRNVHWPPSHLKTKY